MNYLNEELIVKYQTRHYVIIMDVVWLVIIGKLSKAE